MVKHIIKTFAFFDLETTGLEIGKKITELCFVACSRKDILSTKKNEMPRVLNKLSLCVNPFRMIHPESTKITGLDNYMLEYENRLDANVVQTIEGFLNHLQKPICLVAHNGDRFDYPIFRNELAKLNKVLPEHILCVDSLQIFRKMDTVKRDIIHIVEQTDSADEILAVPLTDNVHETGETSSNQNKSFEALTEANTLLNDETDHIFVSIPESVFERHDKVRNDRHIQIVKEKTTPQEGVTIEILAAASEETKETETILTASVRDDGYPRQIQKINETTPSNRTKLNQRKFSHESKEEIVRKKEPQIAQKSKRSLFPTESTAADASAAAPKRIRYRLVDIFERLHGRAPDQSHYAESDTINLMKCAIAEGARFVQYAEEDATNFHRIIE